MASAEPGDHEIIRWARQHGLRYYYVTESSLPGRCLKVHLGHVSAYFYCGKLVRVWVHADGEYLDELFHQLMQLFELCGQIGGYLDQQAVVSQTERRWLLTGRV